MLPSIAGHSVSAVTHNVVPSKIYPDRNLAAQYMQQKGSETTKEGAYQKREDIAAGRSYSGGGPIVLLRLKERLKAFKILKLFRSPVVPLFIWQVRHFIWQVRQIWSRTQMFTTSCRRRGRGAQSEEEEDEVGSPGITLELVSAMRRLRP